MDVWFACEWFTNNGRLNGTCRWSDWIRNRVESRSKIALHLPSPLQIRFVVYWAQSDHWIVTFTYDFTCTDISLYGLDFVIAIETNIKCQQLDFAIVLDSSPCACYRVGPWFCIANVHIPCISSVVLRVVCRHHRRNMPYYPMYSTGWLARN